MIPTKALCIGINYIGSTHALHGCINDALDCRDLLIKQYNYPVESVRLLCDDPSIAGRHAAPTRAAILEGLTWLAEGLQPGQSIALTYSGHGYFVADVASDESDGKDEVMCAVDGIVRDDEIFARLIQKVPAGAQLACLFDCCHSGTLADLPFNVKCQDATGARAKYTIEIESKAVVPGNVFMYSGCYDEQTSLDIRVGGGKRRDAATGRWLMEDGRACGAFTNSLITTLRERRFAVSHRDLVKAINGVLRQKRFEQVSQFSCSQLAVFDQPFAL